MTNYNTFFFKNCTPDAYHFVVYLENIIWQVCGLGPNAISTLPWTLNYQTAIAEWNADSTQITGKQTCPAELGKMYAVEFKQGDIPVINPTPIGTTTSPDIISLKNTTNQKLSLGFAIADNIFVAKDVLGGETLNYKAHPTYYVALYRGINVPKLGSAVDQVYGVLVKVGPIVIKFEDGYHSYEVMSYINNGIVMLKAIPVESSFMLKAAAVPAQLSAKHKPRRNTL